MRKKIIVLIKGGLGNQMFCYAAAKRLAIKTNSQLIIDNKSGFERDYKYQRSYALNNFLINENFANRRQRMEPFKRYRRKIFKLINQYSPFYHRSYIEQVNNDFDSRLLDLKIKKDTYLDGYWQSEQYFIDVENIIRHDLQIIPPSDSQNLILAEKIDNANAVCIHVRWFDPPQKENSCTKNNLGSDYYQKAISIIKEKVISPHFFIFSDHIAETRKFLNLNEQSATFINHNKTDKNAYADLWLMSFCKHFIIANSTFSWWGAWLSTNQNKIIIAPKQVKNGEGAWGFIGLFPETWLII